MQAYIYMIRANRAEMLRTGLNEEESAAFHAHSAYLEDLTKKGTLILAGRTMSPEDSVGIGIFYANSDEEARRIVDNDPFVSRGVVTPTLTQFSVATGTALAK
jgi:uncharacterized protein YciI